MKLTYQQTPAADQDVTSLLILLTLRRESGESTPDHQDGEAGSGRGHGQETPTVWGLGWLWCPGLRLAGGVRRAGWFGAIYCQQ